MSDRFEIPAGEHGVARVFEVMLDDAGAQAAFLQGKDASDWPVVQAFDVVGEDGAPLELDRDYVDAIRAGGLDGVGLANYLTDGLGVPAEAVEGARARLDGIKRPVVIVLSRAFGGAAVTLRAGAPLAWIGSYNEREAAPVQQQTRTVEGYIGQAAAESGASQGSGLLFWGGIIAAIAFIVGLIWFRFSGGLG